MSAEGRDCRDKNLDAPVRWLLPQWNIATVYFISISFIIEAYHKLPTIFIGIIKALTNFC